MTTTGLSSVRRTLVLVRALQNDFSGNLGLSQVEAKLFVLLSMLGATDEPGMAYAYFPMRGLKHFAEAERIPYKTLLNAKASLIKKGFWVDLDHSLVINGGTKAEMVGTGDLKRKREQRLFQGRGAGRGSLRWKGVKGFAMPMPVMDQLITYNTACLDGRTVDASVPAPSFSVLSDTEVRHLQERFLSDEHRGYLEKVHNYSFPKVTRPSTPDEYMHERYQMGRELDKTRRELDVWKSLIESPPDPVEEQVRPDGSTAGETSYRSEFLRRRSHRSGDDELRSSAEGDQSRSRE